MYRVLLVLLALTPVASAQTKGQLRRAERRDFERLSDSGVRGVVTLGFDEEAFRRFTERHRYEAAFVLDGLPLPGGVEARMELRPVSAMEPGAAAQVVSEDGSVVTLEPRVRCFAGHVEGGGPVFLGMTPGSVQGYLTYGGELYFLSTGEVPRRGRSTVAHSSQTGGSEPLACGLQRERFASETFGPEDARIAAVTPLLRAADIFVEVDNVFRGRFASDQECLDYTVMLYTAASEVYRRDLGVRLRIPNGYLRIWKTVPPWGVITGFNQLKNVYTWWLSTANPLRNIPCRCSRTRSSAAPRAAPAGCATTCVPTRSPASAGASRTRRSTPAATTGTCSWCATSSATPSARCTARTTRRRSSAPTARGRTPARS